MSRAGVIVTKYKLDSYLYVSQDLDLIVPMADKADDKNKKTVKKSSTGSRSKPKTTDKRKAYVRNPFFKMPPFLLTMKMTMMAMINLLLTGQEVKLAPQLPWNFFTISWENWTRDFQF